MLNRFPPSLGFQIKHIMHQHNFCLSNNRLPLRRLAVMHLMATNAALCVRTLIEETWEDFLLDYLKSSMSKGDGGELYIIVRAQHSLQIKHDGKFPEYKK